MSSWKDTESVQFILRSGVTDPPGQTSPELSFWCPYYEDDFTIFSLRSVFIFVIPDRQSQLVYCYGICFVYK
jgi:hypothetical protein